MRSTLFPEIQAFIEDSEIIKLIDNGDFDSIYADKIAYAYSDTLDIEEFTGAFTEAMLSADINPLDYMKYIPPCFLYASDIEHFVIPDHIKDILYSAFDLCDKLKHIVLHKNIEVVHNYAFYGCDQLTSIDIQNPNCSISEVGFPAFIPVVRYDGTLEQWRDFITKNKLEFLECNRLELTDREIFQYKIEKIN